MLVLSDRAIVVGAEPTHRLVMRRSGRAALATFELTTCAQADPVTVRSTQERALDRGDASQLTTADRQTAAREDLALDHAPAELLVVVVAFVVAVVDAAD